MADGGVKIKNAGVAIANNKSGDNNLHFKITSYKCSFGKVIKFLMTG
jgi:hypothetical protein